MPRGATFAHAHKRPTLKWRPTAVSDGTSWESVVFVSVSNYCVPIAEAACWRFGVGVAGFDLAVRG